MRHWPNEGIVTHRTPDGESAVWRIGIGQMGEMASWGVERGAHLYQVLTVLSLLRFHPLMPEFAHAPRPTVTVIHSRQDSVRAVSRWGRQRGG
jgi:hypothetical protein